MPPLSAPGPGRQRAPRAHSRSSGPESVRNLGAPSDGSVPLRFLFSPVVPLASFLHPTAPPGDLRPHRGGSARAARPRWPRPRFPGTTVPCLPGAPFPRRRTVPLLLNKHLSHLGPLPKLHDSTLKLPNVTARSAARWSQPTAHPLASPAPLFFAPFPST